MSVLSQCIRWWTRDTYIYIYYLQTRFSMMVFAFQVNLVIYKPPYGTIRCTRQSDILTERHINRKRLICHESWDNTGTSCYLQAYVCRFPKHIIFVVNNRRCVADRISPCILSRNLHLLTFDTLGTICESRYTAMVKHRQTSAFFIQIILITQCDWNTTV